MPNQVYILNNIQIIFIALPLIYVFIKEAQKRKLPIKAAAMAVGIFLVAIFEPLIYDNITLSTYLFFNFMSSIGFLFLLVGIFRKVD